MNKCVHCGTTDVGTPDSELRPYGPGGAMVCFPCGMEHIEETEKQLGAALDACGPDVLLTEHGPLPLREWFGSGQRNEGE